ncbi:MAG: SanA/YdcF family protein [Ruminococcus sp.]
MIIPAVIILLLCLAASFVNLYIIVSAKKRILTCDSFAASQDCDYILILGAAVWPGNIPCPILEDRLLTGISLYNQNPASLLLMSGDSHSSGYNEVSVMKEFAVRHGVPEKNIRTDPAGFTTFDSARRARDIFHAKKMIIVTQKYHMYRALYISRKLGIESWGVVSDRRPYRRRCYREFREILARIKYFFLT